MHLSNLFFEELNDTDSSKDLRNVVDIDPVSLDDSRTIQHRISLFVLDGPKNFIAGVNSQEDSIHRIA